MRATDSPDAIEPVDLVPFTVKTYDLDTAGEAVAPAVGPETAVLCLQNGVEAETRLGASIELDALSGAVVRLGHEAGVPTPLSFAIVAALRPYERRAAAAHAGSR